MKTFKLVQSLFFFSMLFASSLSLYAQKNPMKFGSIDIKNLKMTSYEKDTAAVAVVLCDYGTSLQNAENGYLVTHTRHTRIKILKKGGFRWADIVINGSPSNFKAVTYNLVNGEIEKTRYVKTKGHKVTSGRYTVAFKITMPKVEVGSIIEYTYNVTNLFTRFKGWKFQSTIPTVLSEYRGVFNVYFSYKKVHTGIIPFSVMNNSGNRFRFVANNIPAIKEEEYVRQINDYAAGVEFELESITGDITFGNWKNIDEYLLRDDYYGKWLKGRGVKSIVKKMTAELSTQQEKIDTIYNFVTKNIKHNGRNGIFPRQTAAEILKKKLASSAGINMLLLAMLKNLDLKVAPVLLGTRDYRKPHITAPYFSRFNYVICSLDLDGKKYLLDATDPLNPMGELPFRCMNANGKLVLGEVTTIPKEYHWISLESGISATNLTMATVILEDDGFLSGSIATSAKGKSAYALREKYADKGEKEIIKHYRTASNNADISNFKLRNIENIGKTIKASFDIEIDDAADAAGDLIYLNPMMGFEEKENPFKKEGENREFNIELKLTSNTTLISNFTLPKGYIIESQPKNMSMVLPENGGKFTYRIAKVGENIQLMSKIVISRTIFSPNEYAYLKHFYNAILAKQAEKIVLKKQEE